MNSGNKESITQLTKNGIKEIVDKKKGKVVVQVLELEKSQMSKFSLAISDGTTKMRCLLGNQAAKTAEEVNLQNYTVIQANEYLYNGSNPQNQVIIINNIDVVYTNITEVIGNPIDWDAYQGNGYQNLEGSNEIPSKFFSKKKVLVSKPTNNRPTSMGVINQLTTNNAPASTSTTATSTTATSTIAISTSPLANNSQHNQKKQTNTIQPQTSTIVSKTRSSGSDPKFQILSKSDTAKPPTPTTQLTNPLIVLNSSSSLTHQRTASFGQAEFPANNSQTTSTNSLELNKIKPRVMSGSHQKKITELSPDDFTPISSLVEHNSSFTIRAKVISKTELRVYTKKGMPSQVFSIEIADSDGGEIQCSFFGDLALEFFERVQQDHVYVFSGGTVRPSNSKFQTLDSSLFEYYSFYNRTNNKYQIAFDKTTKIEEIDDDGTFEHQNFKFVSLKEIEQLEINRIVDVLVLVKDVGPCSDMPLKTKETKPRRILELYDSTLYTTLWGELAKNCFVKKHDVLLGRGLRVSEFLSKKHLACTLVSNVLWGDALPKIPEVQKLIQWRNSHRIDESEFVRLSALPEQEPQFCKTLTQIEDAAAGLQEERRFFDVKVYITQIKNDDGSSMFYYACPSEKCLKKLTGDETLGWVCPGCGPLVNKPLLRYTLSLRVEDNTSSLWLTAFHREAEMILNTTVEHFSELKEKGNEAKVQELIQEACCYEWKMRLSINQEYYKGENRIRYRIVKCSRYYPPGILLEYVKTNGDRETKSIDLLNLSNETNVEQLVNEIVLEEPIIPESKKPQLKSLIQKLIEKMESKKYQSFQLHKTLKAHLLPLTNVAFNKSGDKFITGSYDRTCKIWDTNLCEELFTLEGHKNVVYTIAFNNPFGDKIATGSFDKTAKIWDANKGTLYHTLAGHELEIVCLSFDPQGQLLATGSMDSRCKLWDVETGKEYGTLKGHTAEIVSLNFNAEGDKILTGSFDTTAKIWDTRTGSCIHTLEEHTAEISSTQFEFTGDFCATGSIDRTCKVWDIGSGKCIETFRGHVDEVLDISFNSTGTKLITASADGTARVYNVMNGACTAILTGHKGEISKVSLNPQGTKVITAGVDKTARIWSIETGDELQVLEGHTEEIFSCAFNYEGDTIITGSKDNTCKIWKDQKSKKYNDDEY